MRIAVCDDEKEIRELLAEKIQALYPKAELFLFASGDKLLLSGEQPDILLLDIQMSGKNGMETAAEFRAGNKDAILIFVTALSDFVFQAFDVGAFHYLVKPFDDKKLAEVLDRAVKQLAQRAGGAEQKERKRLTINAGGGHVTVSLDELVYAEVFDRKVLLHTTNGELVYYGKLKELEETAGDEFFRPHRGYLVNLNYVKSYNAAEIVLEKGRALMSKKRYREFVERYLRFNQTKRGG